MEYLSAYPLARSAGVFLLIIGAAIVCGAFSMRSRYRFLGVGAGIATALTAATAVTLARPHGAPTDAQVAWLLAAVLLEIALLMVVTPRAARRGDRKLTALILVIVGLHFIPMTPAFGPILLVLGVACTVNALAALRWTDYPLHTLWAVDGAMKALAGAVLFFIARLPL